MKVIVNKKETRVKVNDPKKSVVVVANPSVSVVTVAKQGPPGIMGETGNTGPQGVQGPKGDTGNQGPQGMQGPKGDTGDQGPQGVQGPKGDTGDQGPQGVQGQKGDTGDQGPQGVQGPKGDTGDQGPQGVQGPSGISMIATTVSDQSFTSITPENVTGLSVSLAADVTYRIQVFILFQSATTTTGIKTALTYPLSTVASFVSNLPLGSDGSSAMSDGWHTSSDDTVTGTSVPAGLTTFIAKIEGIIRPAGVAGILQIKAATEVANSAITIKAFSQLLVSVLS